jgi:hypothetical protein
MAAGNYRLVGAERLKPELVRLGLEWTAEGEMLVGTGTASDDAVAIIASKLQALGFAFSAGRDWSPAEVMAHLRHIGLLTGTFTEIAWSGPDYWSLREI